jgi:hypothetical protein
MQTAGTRGTFTWRGRLPVGARVRIVAGELTSPPLAFR